MKRLWTAAACGLWLAGCAANADNRVWLDLDGRPVETAHEARQLQDAFRLCHVIESNYGILGQPADLTSSCMAAQGFTLTGTLEAQTRPILPAGH